MNKKYIMTKNYLHVTVTVSGLYVVLLVSVRRIFVIQKVFVFGDLLKKKSRNCRQDPDENYRMQNKVSPIAVTEGTRWTNLLLTHLSELIQLLPKLHHLHPEHPPAFRQCVVIRMLLQSFKFDSMKSYFKKGSDQFRLFFI